MAKMLLISKEFLQTVIDFLEHEQSDAIEYSLTDLVEDIETFHGSKETKDSKH